MKVRYVHPNVETFLLLLERSARTKLTRLLELLLERKQQLGMPFSKNLGGGLYELRILGTHNIRVFYAFHKSDIVLLHGMSKKTQKLAKRDIETARQRLTLLRQT